MKKTILIALASIIVVTVLIYFVRARSKSFRDSMDALIPFNPFNLGNIVLKQEQESFISELHPSIQPAFRSAIAECEDNGWSIICTSGYRPSSKQAQLYAQNSKNAAPGYSLHEFGFALDINAVKGTTALRKATSTKTWKDSGIVAIFKKHGLDWGGTFSGYADRVHFYFDPGRTLLRGLASAQFGSDVSKWKGNQIKL